MGRLFHSMTSRLLFAAKIARPDIQVDVAYLCTRGRAPTVSDYQILIGVVRYLRGIKRLPLIIGWDKTGKILWNIDALFTVHDDILYTWVDVIYIHLLSHYYVMVYLF